MPIVVNEIEIVPEPPAAASRSPGSSPPSSPAGTTPELTPQDLWEIQRHLAERAARLLAH